jgi:hypothetical protein
VTVDPDACDGVTCAEAPAIVIHREAFGGKHQTDDGPCNCRPTVYCSGCGGRKPSTTPTLGSRTWWATE